MSGTISSRSVAEPNQKKIREQVERSLMLVTALSPVIGYDKAPKIVHYAADNDLTLKGAALKLCFVTAVDSAASSIPGKWSNLTSRQSRRRQQLRLRITQRTPAHGSEPAPLS